MKKLLYTALAFAPSLALAQGAPTLSNLQVLLGSIRSLVSGALPLVVGLALLAFFYGLMKFIFNSSNEVEKEKGKDIMIYGVIALFVMVAVWGLVQFVANAFGIQTGGNLPGGIPTIPGL